MGQLFFHEESVYEINFTEKWKNQSKFKNSVFLSKFDEKFSKVKQVIYSSASTGIQNMKALA